MWSQKEGRTSIARNFGIFLARNLGILLLYRNRLVYRQLVGDISFFETRKLKYM